MGYNTWNYFHCNVDESAVVRTARLLIDLGLAAKGYAYVNVDDCWQVGRDGAGNIVADPARFPGGMKAVADAVHALGMKYGIYTASHEFTCQGRPGSYLHETRDADAYCAFEVDYVKIDACGGRGYAKRDRTASILPLAVRRRSGPRSGPRSQKSEVPGRQVGRPPGRSRGPTANRSEDDVCARDSSEAR